MLAKDIMRKDVVTLRPLMTLREAGAVLAERGITGAPVIDRRGEIMGVVSQSDIVRCGAGRDKAGLPLFYSDDDDSPVEAFSRSEFDVLRVVDVMTNHVISAEEEAPVEELIATMLRSGVHRVVITRKGKLAGIVTTMDILRILPGAPLR